MSYCFSVERTALPEELLCQEYFCKNPTRNISPSPSTAGATGNVKFSLLHNQNSVNLSISEARAAPCDWIALRDTSWDAIKAGFLLHCGQQTMVLHCSCPWLRRDAACPAQSRASLSTARINPWDKEVSLRQTSAMSTYAGQKPEARRDGGKGEGGSRRVWGAASPRRPGRNHSEDRLWLTRTGINMLQPQLEVLEPSVNESPNSALHSSLAP